MEGMSAKHILSAVLSISTDGRRKVSATLLGEVGYFFPLIEETRERSFQTLLMQSATLFELAAYFKFY